MWSVKCGVWSVKCGVESVECECKVWSVKCEFSVEWTVECKAPRFPIDTATLVSLWSRTHIPAETHRMSQGAMPATQNDMTTSSDTSRKTCFGSVSHRHGNFTLTTVARGRLQTVAMGCGHQKQGHANTSSPPDPQNVKRKPFALHSRKIWIQMVLPQFLPNVQKQKNPHLRNKKI